MEKETASPAVVHNIHHDDYLQPTPAGGLVDNTVGSHNQALISSNENHIYHQNQSLSEGEQPSIQTYVEKPEFIGQGSDGPDGGVPGWLQVLAAFLLVLDGFGFITSFGIFQKHYQGRFPGKEDSDISWIGTMQIFLLFLLGTASGRAIDAGFFRLTLILGFVFQLGGVFGASFSTEYWQVFLSQGIATGIRNGMHFTSLVWLVSQYFTKRRGLALGISSCGAPIGAVLITVIAKQMIPRVDTPWTLRTMGFLILFDSIIIFIIARPKQATRKSGQLLELLAFKELPYLLFTIGMFFGMLGVYFAILYVPVFSSKRLHANGDGALTILIVMSAVGITGRLIPPYLADRSIKPLRTLVISLLLSGVNLFAWIAVKSVAGLYVWVVAYAFTANAVQTLFTASMGEVTSDMSKLGVRIGMVFTVISFACLIGSPVAAKLVKINHDDFLYAQVFAGTSMLLGGVLVALAKIKQVGQNNFWRI
ncbi:major facilitator superfamily transporter [Colletotrichum incanum]|uniref:Major facilitator superfamily transporter n=1 Tax=Colletotrichum incanum TaxID=1573173 RepID=A0A166MUI9_COLIC|nr:major facilitator superfamily transporter [Colletotrichum incanum]